MCFQMVARHCFCDSEVCAKTQHESKEHDPHMPGFQWGYTVLEQIQDVVCPATKENPKGEQDKCENILKGTLRIVERCPCCVAVCCEKGMPRDPADGRAFETEGLPDEKTFVGTTWQWAEAVAEGRRRWQDKLLRERGGYRW